VIISVINHTNGELKDSEVQEGIRIVNKQIHEDFEPYWSMGATLRLEGKSTKKPNELKHPDLRGDAIIYLWNKSDTTAPLGYHTQNYQGIPYSFVFTDLAKELGDEWTTVLSHEALEMIADPDVNLLVIGPNPDDRRKKVFYFYEVCDAVQSDTYKIDGRNVSNFVLPLYFTSGDEFEGRNDFLGMSHEDKTLRSFGVNPGGYMEYWNPLDRKIGQIFGDKKAKMRMKKKERVGNQRRGARYRFLTSNFNSKK